MGRGKSKRNEDARHQQGDADATSHRDVKEGRKKKRTMRKMRKRSAQAQESKGRKTRKKRTRM